MTLTLNVPDEFAAFLPSKDADIAVVLSAGLRRWRGRENSEIQELADIAETLAGLPSPEEVMALHPSRQLSERTSELLEKSRSSGLSLEEQAEWEQIMRIEHLVRIAKAKALIKLKADGKAA